MYKRKDSDFLVWNSRVHKLLMELRNTDGLTQEQRNRIAHEIEHFPDNTNAALRRFSPIQKPRSWDKEDYIDAVTSFCLTMLSLCCFGLVVVFLYAVFNGSLRDDCYSACIEKHNERTAQ